MKKVSIFLSGFLLFMFSATPTFAVGSFDISNLEITSGSNIHFDFSTLAGDNVITAVGLMCDSSWIFNPGNSAVSFTQTGQHLEVTTSLYDGSPYEDCQMYIYDLGSANDYASTQIFSVPTLTSSVEIVTSPESGNKTVGSPFSVNVAVNSDEEAFNAARATVAISSNLSINSVSAPTSNACNMQYTQTPSTTNPSFAGAIYGASSESCNVYTMVLTPTATGTGTIMFTNGSVKSYVDNSEIMTGVTNASFTLGDGPTPTPTAMLEFAVTSPVETYKENFNITGTKLDTIIAMFVNGSDDDSTYPTSTTWSVPVMLSMGENNFTLYGSDGENQTATQNLIVDRHTLGDINGDGEIDLIDASLFAVDWDKTEDLIYVLSDMNDDGVVNLTDLSILAKLQE